ncbi:MAG: hypothetical protein K2G30_08530 [Muribaculaceae bacterium]|nr:hypothetical protein [Muribaculaceae bacterium]
MSSKKLPRLAVAAWLIAIMAASCGREEQKPLQEYVTSSASVAAIVDLKDIFRQAGMPLGHPQPMLEGIQEDILSLSTFSIMTNALSQLVATRAIDGEVLLVTLDDRSEVAVVTVVDEDALRRVTDDEMYKAVVTRRGSLCFLAADKEISERVISEAEQEASASLVSVREHLAGKGDMRVAMHSAATDFAATRAEWALSTVSVSAEAISSETILLDNDGRQQPFGCVFAEIDPAVAGFIPPEAIVAGAFGAPSREIKGLDKALLSYAGISASEITGTSAFSLALAGSVDNIRTAGPDAFNIQFLTAATPEFGDSLVDRLADRFGGAAYVAGQYVSGTPGDGGIFLCATDGYFVESLNRPVSSGYNNDFASAFEGKRAALAVEIPYGSSAMKNLGLPAGISLRIALTADRLKARLRFNHSDNPAILTLLELNKDLAAWLAEAPALLL